MSQNPFRLPALLAVTLVLIVTNSGTLQAGPDQTTNKPPAPAEKKVCSISGAPHYALALSADGKLLAAAGRDSLHLYDVSTQKELNRVEVKSEALGDWGYLTFSPDGRYLASVHDGDLIDLPRYFVNLWHVTDEGRLEKVGELMARKKDYYRDAPWQIYHAAFSPDSKALAAGTPGGIVHIWETATGKEQRRWPGGAAAAFSPDGRTLVSVTQDGLVRQWRADTGKEIDARTRGKRKDFVCVEGVAFAMTGGRLVLWDKNTVSLKELPGGSEARRLAFPWGVEAAALSPDGRTLAVTERKSGIWLLDGPSGKPLGWHQGEGPIAFSADGKLVAWAEGTAVVVRKLADLLAGPVLLPKPVFSDPPDVPLQAELVARKSTYSLDLGGRTPEQFSQLIITSRQAPVPSVDLELRLRNTGNHALKFDTDWEPKLFLRGPGAMNIQYWGQVGQDVGVPGPDDPIPHETNLAPGKTVALPITRLDQSIAGQEFWLLPGEYEISASYSAYVSPAPKGAKPLFKNPIFDNWGLVVVRTAPIRLQVIEKKN